jgi:hypothetical protein
MLLGLLRILSTFATYLTTASVVFGLLKITWFFWRNSRSPLFQLSGPLHQSGLSVEGDFHDIRDTFVGNQLFLVGTR